MIEYIELRGSDTNVIGIIDIAKSIIWHSVFFSVGDFEITAAATAETVSLLLAGRYVSRPDNDDVGIIEKLYLTETVEDGAIITASGRFVKSILDRRLIYNLSGKSNKATILYGNVENEVREVVKANAIDCPFDSNRNFELLELGASANIPLRIVGADGAAARKQVSYGNLLSYTDGVLEEYGLASKCILNNGKFQYVVYAGTDRSTNNTAGNTPVIFSTEFDNLTSSEYSYDETAERNVALIGGEGEGVDRFYSIIDNGEKGLQRRELFVDASSISKKYTDDNDVEQEYDDETYKTMLDTKGKQDIVPYVKKETFDGALDATNGNYVFGRDFTLGDIVTVQSNNIGKYVNVRIGEVLEYQDENGYTVEIKYQ